MINDPRFLAWLEALERRHLANLRVPELTRALRALSSVYVERRNALARGAALDSAGKRAAFAVFYGPLHYLVSAEIVRALDAGEPDSAGLNVRGCRSDRVIDLGCGTGAAGAAWAAALGGRTRVVGFDRHPWAVAETAWTYHALGLDGAARRVDVGRVRLPTGRPAIVLAFTVNELPGDVRGALLPRLLGAARAGTRLLVIEPIARPVGFWWDEWSEAFARAGGREDTWRFPAELPDRLRTFDEAAGLDHSVLTARSLYLDGGKPEAGRRTPDQSQA